ncbi:MAG: transposase, partial [Saprospiraceae bacterium]
QIACPDTSGTTLEVDKIKKYFPFHRVCLVKTLVILVSCILLANNCNLNKAKKKGSLALSRVVNIETVYTRFIRFFKIKNPLIFVICILRLIQHLLSDYISKQSEYVLSIDRTNWKLGTVNINILTVGLVLDNGRFIPLYFELLNKRGNSNQSERKMLLSELHTIFNISKPLVLVGDREFIGKDWFKELVDLSYDLVIRLRKKDYKELLADQMHITLIQLENKIRNDISVKGYFTAQIEIKGHLFFYHVRLLKGQKDELSKADKDIYIRFISTSQEINWVSNTYDKRCLPRNLGGKIEVFFEDIKEKGIRLEQINFKDFDKIRLMVAVAALCYALCLNQGLISFKKRLIPQKKDIRSQKSYPRTSIFTKRYEIIEQTILNANKLNELIMRILEQEKHIIYNYPIILFIRSRASFE